MVAGMEQERSFLTGYKSPKNSSASSIIMKKCMDNLFGKMETGTSADLRTRDHTGRANSKLLKKKLKESIKMVGCMGKPSSTIYITKIFKASKGK
jgi:hypothetical protein